MSKAYNNVLKLNDIISVKDFGAVGDGATDDTAAIQAAIDSIDNTQSLGRAGGTTLIFPEGIYRTTTSLLVDDVNITIVGNDARINHSGANPCFLVGNVSYLTDLAAGYYFFGLENLSIYLSNAAGVGIRNNGYRRLGIRRIYVNGGLIGFDSEAAWSLSFIENSTFQSQTGSGSRGVNLKQRNNLFRLDSVGVLSGAEIGFYLSTSTAELKGVVLSSCDAEGCAIGYQVDGGNIGSITFLSCWGENNTTLDINIPNTTGTNKSALNIFGGQFDRGVRIGLAGQTGDIRSSLVQGIDFSGGIGLDILVDEGVTVGQNQYGGTATLAFSGQGYGENARGPNGLLMNRYTQNINVPNSSAQGGNMLGDIRWTANRLYVSTALANPFWQTTQLQKFVAPTDLIPNLPTGATPSAANLKSCITANGSATTITDFTNGFTGQELIISGDSTGNTTIAHGTSIRLPGGSNITLGEHDVVHLVCRRANASLWVCVSYSNNT
jgi:hypothetical protein